MGVSIRRVRFAILFLVLFAIGRFILGARGVPYASGTNIFSLVTFSYIGSLLYGAFSKPLWGARLPQAMMLGVAIGLSGQIIIFLSTLFSYLAATETYFNHPTALNVEQAIPLAQALGTRALGLVINPIAASIAALIGWSLGGLIPKS
jgi:hypothetical protein